MPKAKSRLTSLPAQSYSSQSSSSTRLKLRRPLSRQNNQNDPKKRSHGNLGKIGRAYSRYLPTLLMAAIFFLPVYHILTKIYPEQIRHWLLPNSYLPLQIPLFLADFFLFSFLLLSCRRGFFASLLISSLLFLKLQAVRLPWQLVLGMVTSFVIIELIVNYFVSHHHTQHSTQHSQPKLRDHNH